MTLNPALLEVLACPSDRGPLLYLADENVLYNPREKRCYSVRDGIAVLLIEESKIVDQAEHDRIMAKVAADGIKPTFQA
jgi:uncharacterized protein YbaR (Trm112 family)